MPEIEQKIKKIQNSVLRSVGAEKKMLLSEINAYREARLQETRNKIDEQFGARLETRRRELEVEAREAISKAEFEAYQHLTGERNELTDRIFATVTERLVEFCGTPEYIEFLKTNIQQAIDTLQMRQPVLLLCKRDLSFGQEIVKALSPAPQLNADEMMTIGGFKLLSLADGVILDRSFTAQLAEEREKFRTYCTLSIR